MKLKPVIVGLALIIAFGVPLPLPAASPIVCEGKTLAVLGDSLVAGYGLGPGEGFPENLARKLAERGYKINLVNAGLSGDTSSGGLARLNWSLPETVDAVIVELGINDAFRGISPEIIHDNLKSIIVSLKSRGNEVLLAGMLAPPNMGKAYGDKFNAIYPALAMDTGVMLYPFFLEGVAAQRELNQADGIHPTLEGIELIVEKFVPYAIRLMQKVCSK